MENFRGFTEQTNDFLVGIKFNNNKEWFKFYDLRIINFEISSILKYL